MRRRGTGRRLSAEECWALRVAAEAKVAHLPESQRVRALQVQLSPHGVTTLQCLQAAYWLRRGKPAHYVPARRFGWVRPEEDS